METLLRKLRAAAHVLLNPDFEQVADEIGRGKLRYRVQKVSGGWEPQQLYTCGAIRKTVWFPLNSRGYWVQPEAFSYGDITERAPLPTKRLAADAIKRARRANLAEQPAAMLRAV